MIQDPIREQWNTPVLNGLLACGWRNAKESETPILLRSGDKKSIPGILDVV